MKMAVKAFALQDTKNKVVQMVLLQASNLSMYAVSCQINLFLATVTIIITRIYPISSMVHAMPFSKPTNGAMLTTTHTGGTV